MSAADWRAGALAVLAELRAELDQNAAEEDAADVRAASHVPPRMSHAHRAAAFRVALASVKRIEARILTAPSLAEDIGTRTPYQRGNRDGLIYLAAEIDALATEAQRARDGARAVDARRRVSDERMSIHHAAVRQTCVRVASLARRRAESLPMDPEDPNE